MTGRETMAFTEKSVATHLLHLGIDLKAQAALSNLYRAANATRKHLSSTVLKESDLTWTSFVVLWVVWMQDAIETRQAAEESAITKATLTGVVKTLEGRGLVARERDASDRRLVHLSLTETGRTLMEDLFPRFNAEEVRIVSTLSKSRLAELTKGLKESVAQLESGAHAQDSAAATAVVD